MNPRSIKILSYIEANGGRVPISDLNNVTENGARFIAPLTVGQLPNCVKEGPLVLITEKGLRTLHEAGVPTTLAIAPIIKREASTSSSPTSILNIRIDRNSDVKLTCQLSPSFINFLKSSGQLLTVQESRGSGFSKNWDCTSTTSYIETDLKTLDDNFSNKSSIITPDGINPFIIKLAAANGGSWTVTYKGLISKENLISYATALRDKAKSFYYSYVKPIKIEISISVVE